MKQTNELDVALDVQSGSSMPLVAVTIQKDGVTIQGVFLLDSGCTDNFISSSVVSNLNLEETCEERSIIGINKGVYIAPSCTVAFWLNESLHAEPFFVERNNLLQGDIIGILGVKFLQRNNLAIDFSKKKLHTSIVTPSNLSIGDCSYFFPMMIGLKAYGVPVVQMKGRNEKDYVVMVDTGSERNVVAENIYQEASLHYKTMKNRGTLETMVGTVDIWDALLEFQLGTLTSEPDPVKFQTHKAVFQVTPVDALLAFDPDPRIPDELGVEDIDVLLGSDFIASQGWVLDFGAKIIYARK